MFARMFREGIVLAFFVMKKGVIFMCCLISDIKFSEFVAMKTETAQ